MSAVNRLINKCRQIKADRMIRYGIDWTLPDLADAELAALRAENDALAVLVKILERQNAALRDAVKEFDEEQP